MKSVFNYKGIALIAWSLLLACCCIRADAQSITLTQSLSGADGSLAVDSSRTVVDSVSMYPGSFPTVANTSSMDNLVMLYVDELSIRMPPDSFKVDVEVRIYYTNRLGASDSITSTTLSVEYSQLRQYNHRAVFYFKDAQSVQVKVLSISSSTSNLPAALPFLILENRIVVNRVFEMDCVSDIVTGLSQNTDIVSTKGELGVSWSSLNAAQAYDLEWTYVDQTALDAGWFDSGGVLDADLLFRNNATRVTVAANAYNIPLLYESEGKLFYRVRGVQTTVDGERKVTRWSSDNSLGEYAFSGHEVSLNWQASTSFAEEGKRKSVVQYFDGTLRNRQTVTKDNETDTTIVAETFYDKQGRAVIQVLPSPSLSTLIKYNPLYNRDTFSLEYSKESYDTLLSAAAYCNTAAPRMDSAYGTARYYSRNNPFYSQLHDQHIPRAEGFPFTEVKYTQDNTGRILVQGGVGKPFQLDSAHATKYYYGVPEQQDLDALFGTEAGYAAHYQKNMVRDANGQYSVSYVDMHGRTVATALAGDVPSSLAALDSYSNTSAEYQLLNRNNNVVLNGSVIATKSLLVPKAGLHTFKYKLAADSLSLKDKDNADICYECLYDLTITITDDCNNQLLPGGKPYVFEANNLSVAPLPYDTSCNEVSDFDAQFSITLAEGSYVITKMLTLREDARNWYRDSLYAPHNTVSSKEDIIAEQLDKIRAQNDTSCNQPVVPWYPYEQYREQMLLDLSPPLGNMH